MGSNNYTKQYSDGNALTTAMLDTAYQTLTPDLSNTTQMTIGSTSGQVLTSNGAGAAAVWQAVSDPLGPFALRNYGFSAAASSGTLKVTLLNNGLTTPSGSSPVDLTFSTNGVSSATYSKVQVTNALAFTVSASATLGFIGTSTNRIYIYALNNSGTPILGVSARSDLDHGSAQSTSAMSASADSGQTLYATAALTVATRLLGWVEAALNSSGQWQSPTKANITNNANVQNAVKSYIRNTATGSAASSVNTVQVSNAASTTSSTTGSYVTISGTYIQVTCTGKPVKLSIQPNSGITPCSFTQPVGTEFQIGIFKDGTSTSCAIGVIKLDVPTGITGPVISGAICQNPCFTVTDKTPTAGVHNYQVQVANVHGSGSFTMSGYTLVAEEIN